MVTWPCSATQRAWLVLPKAQEPDLLIQLAKSLRPEQRLLPIVESVLAGTGPANWPAPPRWTG
jgi:hypothetical protein